LVLKGVWVVLLVCTGAIVKNGPVTAKPSTKPVYTHTPTYYPFWTNAPKVTTATSYPFWTIAPTNAPKVTTAATYSGMNS
jgi:hypothetical protein